MCAIAGIYNFNGADADPLLLRKFADVLKHRGPDGEGFFIDNNVGLCHRRLKIVDLSDEANQPLFNEDKTRALVFNGEIYNYLELRRDLSALGHSFRSHSDSEVVLHAYEQWGRGCLDKFIGMWAFCIWNRNDDRLFIARDRFGVKPLYYFYNENFFIFASEIKAILEARDVKREVNPQAVYEYLYLGYTLGDKTWFRGINQLAPGCYLLLEKGRLSARKYWDIRPEIDYSVNKEKAKERIRYLLEDAVRLRLRSDVEVGAHLSGGIDSSAVVSLAARALNRDIHTFSGVFMEGAEYDERYFIQEMLKRYRTIRHHEIVIRADNFLETMRGIVWHLDEPAAGPGAYPQYFVSREIHNAGIKVILGGQGGDELFCGYPYYYSGLIHSCARLIREGRQREFFGCFSGSISPRSIFQYGKRALGGYLALRKKRINRLLQEDFLRQADARAVEENSGHYQGTVDAMMLWDIRHYLPALLQVEDRMSMACSVETRLPLLDHRLAEAVMTLPFYFKVRNNSFKYILREAVKDILPLLIYQRKDKKGFPTPVKLWLADAGLRQRLEQETARPAERFFKKDSPLTWEKINIGLWLKIFQIA